MLHVLWVILKIILIILAVVVGLLFLILLLVLFAPIRYKVAADIGDDIAVTAKVRFLIVSVNVIFEKNEKKLDTFLRIVGIKIGLGDKEGEGHKEKKSKPKKERKKKNKADEPVDESDTDTANAFKDTKYDALAEDKALDASNPIEAVEGEADVGEYNLWMDENTLEEDEKTFSGRIRRFIDRAKRLSEEAGELSDKSEEEIKETLYQKLEKKVNQLKDKKEELEKKVNRFKKFWDMKCTVKTREYLGKYLISILKHIAPKKIKGHIRYGFDEPCTTGQVTGYLSLLPFVYQKGFSLEPDFREKVIEGNVVLKGRIILGYIARIVLKRYIWQTIKMARKI